tara:strand:+ start:370 stop:648 length:279 start_codon:yes stop_codon:yes gene_type:complete
MSWKEIIKATYMPMGKNINEKTENIIYYVRQNFPNNAMDEFLEKRKKLLLDNENGIDSNRETIQKLFDLQNYFTRQDGVRDAYIKIISEYRE